ncbi:hypothetical protein DAEQUDRAFT_703823 [Daedalea quercina L-15889]|uniref:AhpC-TSA-domain-containing protein n=1 Tax=Daedalea quercina L-15889 TaxID=1314783 RepID=A0A165TGD6_9APHY|nr:hypothetical protein DAEQUDRAFT_703823 [Daedalea quercina L-15889]
MEENAYPEQTRPPVPSTQDVAEATKLIVYDSQGNSIEFGNLIRHQKTVVVFIRHFFCGSCQQYVMQLALVPPESLQQAGARLVVIGCGEWQPIQNYCETTGFKGEMYADPSRALYKIFGLAENLDGTPTGEERRSYLTKGVLSNAVQSTWKALKVPRLIGKQGKISQLGGDFIFGPGETCSFASRMHHTEDHVEVGDLMRAAGLAYR